MRLSFQVRVGLLATAVLLPLLAYDAWLASRSRLAAREHAANQAHEHNVEATRAWSGALQIARGMLVAGRTVPALSGHRPAEGGVPAADTNGAGGGPPAERNEAGGGPAAPTAQEDCTKALRALVDGPLAALHVVSPTGVSTCTSGPGPAPRAESVTELLHAALTAMRPTLGVLVAEGSPGGTAALAVPLPDEADGVLLAELSLPRLRATDASADLPEGTVALLLNPWGRVIETWPPELGAPGIAMADLGLHPRLLHPDGGTHEDVFLAGEEFLLDVLPLAAARTSPDAYLLLGIPDDRAYSSADALSGTILFSGWLAIFAVLLALGVAADRLLVRRMDSLVALADRLLGDPPGGGEPDAFRRLESALERLTVAAERGGAPFRAAVGLSSDGVLVLSATGRILFANGTATRALGRRLDQVLGAEAHQLLHGGDHAADACPLTAAGQRGGLESGAQDEFHRPFGAPFPVSWRATPVEDGLSFVGTVIVFQELGAHQALVEAAGRVPRLELLRGATLEAVQQLGYHLSNVVAAPDRAPTRELQWLVDRAVPLLGTLRAIARPPASAPPSDLHAVLREVAGWVEQGWKDRVRVLLDLAPSDPLVATGRRTIEGLVLGIASWHAESASPTRTLIVRTRITGTHVEVTLVDEGAEEPTGRPLGFPEPIGLDISVSLQTLDDAGRGTWRVELPIVSHATSQGSAASSDGT